MHGGHDGHTPTIRLRRSLTISLHLTSPFLRPPGRPLHSRFRTCAAPHNEGAQSLMVYLTCASQPLRHAPPSSRRAFPPPLKLHPVRGWHFICGRGCCSCVVVSDLTGTPTSPRSRTADTPHRLWLRRTLTISLPPKPHPFPPPPPPSRCAGDDLYHESYCARQL